MKVVMKRLSKVHCPTVEQCLTRLADSVEYRQGDRKEHRIRPDLKNDFKKAGEFSASFTLKRYNSTVSAFLDGISFNFLPKGDHEAAVQIIRKEISEFLSRYHRLTLQLDLRGTDQKNVNWSVTNWFFVPWLALRINLRLRDLQKGPISELAHCLIPTVRDKQITPCLIQVLDTLVRVEGESDFQLATRIGKISATKQLPSKDLHHLFRHYRKWRASTSDETIDILANCFSDKPELRLLLIIARAIDRNVLLSLDQFGKKKTVELIQYFGFCCRHMELLLNKSNDIVPRDIETAELHIRCLAVFGDHFGATNRFYPLTDETMSLLARRINRELSATSKRNGLFKLPTSFEEFESSLFCDSEPQTGGKVLQLSGTFLNELNARNFLPVLKVSRETFGADLNSEKASAAASILQGYGLVSFDPERASYPFKPSHEDAIEILGEARRLHWEVFQQCPEKEKFQYAEDLLDFLTIPYRPKFPGDSEMAAKAFEIVAHHYEEEGLEGVSQFIEGQLCWLRGARQKALNVFEKAIECGKQHCDKRWIHMLCWAAILSRHISGTRTAKKFERMAKMEGVFPGIHEIRFKGIGTRTPFDQFADQWIKHFKQFPPTKGNLVS